MAAGVVNLQGVEVEQTSLEEGVELRGLGEVGVAMGVGQAGEPCCAKRSLSHLFPNDRSYCNVSSKL